MVHCVIRRKILILQNEMSFLCVSNFIIHTAGHLSFISLWITLLIIIIFLFRLVFSSPVPSHHRNIISSFTRV